MIAPEVAYDKLSQFQSSEDLRIFFNACGTRGRLGNPFSCPIATYMHQETGLVFGVDSREIEEGGRGRWAPYINQARFPTTSAMSGFVERFDYGFYPELVLEEE